MIIYIEKKKKKWDIAAVSKICFESSVNGGFILFDIKVVRVVDYIFEKYWNKNAYSTDRRQEGEGGWVQVQHPLCNLVSAIFQH